MKLNEEKFEKMIAHLEKKYVDVKDMLLNTYHSSFIKVIGTIHDAL